MSELDTVYQWQGRDDLEDGEGGKRWHHALNQQSERADVALLGLASHIGVIANKGRPGAQAGPDAIRDALANFAFHKPLTVVDCGNVVAQSSLPEAQQQYATIVSEHLSSQEFVVGLGGGHEIAWGSYLGLADACAPQKRIGIINFDAHFDLRKPAPDTSSGTPFRQISEHCESQGIEFQYCCLGIAETANTRALFDYADKTNTRYLLDLECQFDAASSLLEDFLQNVDVLYVTLCLDAFPAHLAPGVSAPSALGISVEFVLQVLQWLAQKQSSLQYEWSLVDIAEMNPRFDIDGRTAKLAARLIHEIINAKFG